MVHYTLVFIMTLAASCSTGTGEKKNSRKLASLDADEVADGVRVSKKSFRKLSKEKWATSVTCVVDFSKTDYNKTPGFLKKINQTWDRLHGLFVEGMCGSYAKTRRMAVKKSMGNRLLSFFTLGSYSKFRVISECTDGTVLVYDSPGEFNLAGFFDPDWCGSHSN